jgi:putative transposase
MPKGEVLDVLVSKRNKHAAMKLMRKFLEKYGFVPDRTVTDDLRSYGAPASWGSKTDTRAVAAQ